MKNQGINPTDPSKKPFASQYQEHMSKPPVDPPIPKNDEVTIEFEHKIRQLRLKNLEPLETKKHNAVISLEKDLRDYEQRFLLLRQVFLPFEQNENNTELQQKYSKQQQELKDIGKELVKKYPKLELDDGEFSLLSRPDKTFSSFICQKETLLNTVVSRLTFFANLKIFFDTNQTRILKEFQKADLLDSKFKPSDIEFTCLKYIQEGTEKHNRGKAAVLVHFTFKDHSKFKIVCKPRDALLDQAVINLFKQINQLTSSQRSSPYLLCEYTIISPSQKEDWKINADLGTISLWEFVEGRLSDHNRNAYSCIQLEIEDKKTRKMMSKKLNHLDAILTQLHISDLHCENVLFRGLKSTNPEIIPIDLENIQRGMPSQLGGSPEKVTLTYEEHQLIDNVKKKIENLVVRVLPLNTMNLMALSSYESCERLAEMCMESLEKQDFTLTVSKEELKQLLLKDILHSDVPYLTEFQNMLYYGLPYEKNVIGRRNV